MDPQEAYSRQNLRDLGDWIAKAKTGDPEALRTLRCCIRVASELQDVPWAVIVGLAQVLLNHGKWELEEIIARRGGD